MDQLRESESHLSDIFGYEWLLSSPQKQKEKLTAQSEEKNELPKQLEKI